MEDKFKLYKKWFWIGIAAGFFNLVAGLIYGIALAIEPEHKKEGLIIISWSIVIFIILLYVGNVLRNAGILPELTVAPNIDSTIESQVIPVQ